MDIKKFVKIGRPGYRVTKQRDAENGQQSLLFEVHYIYKVYSYMYLFYISNYYVSNRTSGNKERTGLRTRGYRTGTPVPVQMGVGPDCTRREEDRRFRM